MRQFVMLAAVFLSLAWAQVPVGVNLPEGSALTLSATEVVFDVGKVGFPPPAFPAFYAPTDPSDALLLRLFSNVEGGWFLTAGLDPLEGEAGSLNPEQIEIRLDGGAWIPLGAGVTLLAGQGKSEAYERHALELRLKLTGHEAPGAYRGALRLALVRP